MKLKMLLPKGRIQKGVTDILGKSGLLFSGAERSYRPVCSREDIKAKLLKPQNIPGLVELGRHHCGFTGYDWIREQNSDVIELLDLGTDKARIVFAVPEKTWESQEKEKITVVASEYPSLAENYIAERYPTARVIRSWGATEALPPDDADAIVDVVSSGSTLEMNRLRSVDCILKTSTRFISNRYVYENCAELREKMDVLVMLMQSCMNASSRRLLEMNVPVDSLHSITAILPCMKAPTVAPLQGGAGFSVKVAVPAAEIPELVPVLLRKGATDILESKLERIVSGEVRL